MASAARGIGPALRASRVALTGPTLQSNSIYRHVSVSGLHPSTLPLHFSCSSLKLNYFIICGLSLVIESNWIKSNPSLSYLFGFEIAFSTFYILKFVPQIPLFPPSCKSLHKKLRPFRKPPPFFCNLLSQTSQRYSILAHDSTFFHGTIFSMSCMCLGF